MKNIINAFTFKVAYNQPFHEDGILHHKTTVVFDHSIITNTYKSKTPCSDMGATFIRVVYADGVERAFDDIGWSTHGKHILKNCHLLEIDTIPKHGTKRESK